MEGPFGSEAAGGVILSLNVKTIEGYVVVNLEVSSTSLQDIQISVMPTPSAFHLKYITKISKQQFPGFTPSRVKTW